MIRRKERAANAQAEGEHHHPEGPKQSGTFGFLKLAIGYMTPFFLLPMVFVFGSDVSIWAANFA